MKLKQEKKNEKKREPEFNEKMREKINWIRKKLKIKKHQDINQMRSNKALINEKFKLL